MSNNKDLYKLIENLNLKIKKLDTQIKSKPISSLNNIQNNTIIKAYSISYPNNHDKNKKYIGLMFDENFDDFSTETNISSKNKSPFIKLKKGNNIINYSLCLDIDNFNSNQLNYICLGIKDKTSSKVRIIKGSKYIFNLNNKYQIINDKLIINNTIIYMSDNNEELCMITDLTSKSKINSSKSLIKILML
jgi:hypothetical protein